MSRMLGRLGWHGQCSCCNGPRDKRQEKRAEAIEWRREVSEVIARAPSVLAEVAATRAQTNAVLARSYALDAGKR